MTSATRKVLLVVSMMATLVTSEAFASRARLLTMFTGDGGSVLNGGSFYYDDDYNIFYNPSYVNDFKNWAIIEKSNGLQGAQAGAVGSIGNFNLGLYMNRVETLTGVYARPNTLRPLELFFGSDMGVKWGFGISYGRANRDTQDLTFRAGIQYAGFEPFFSWKAVGKDKVGTVELENDDIMAGLRYRFGEWSPYFAYRDIDGNVGASKVVDTTVVGFGLGRSSKLTEGVTLNYSLGYWNRKLVRTNSQNIVPLDLSVEGDLTNWLTLRGGFAYRTSSAGRLGATIHMGKLDFNWAFGNSDGVESLDDETFDLTDGLFTAASLGIRF